MKEPARKHRNEMMLAECWPSFAKRVRKLIADLEGSGFRPRIQAAHRTIADQRAAYLAGNSKLLYGFHNVTAPDGKPEALAVDLLDDDEPLNPSKSYLVFLAHHCLGRELNTGIYWGLPTTISKGLAAAVAACDQTYSGKVGWDPTHVETLHVTVAEAKAGKRPV